MPKAHTVTLRSQWLGKLLRELREKSGKTLAEAGDYLQRDPSMLSRFETASYPIRRPDVLALINFYGVSDEHTRDALLSLTEEIWRKGWWDDYSDVTDQKFIDHTWLETRAEHVCVYETMFLPGLMQTREYAEVMIRNAEGEHAPEATIESWLDFRMDRQAAFDGDAPKRLSAIVEESALARPVGGLDVWRGQLAHLRTVVARATVDFRVLPTSLGEHAGVDGPFTVFEMPDPYPDVAYVETVAGRIFVETPAAEGVSERYARLRSKALDPQRSEALISSMLKDSR